MTDMAETIQRMQASLRHLRERDARLDQEQRLLMQQREAIRYEMQNLEIAISLFHEYSRRTEDVAPRQTSAFPAPIAGTIAEAAVTLIEQNGGTMEFGELHEALKRAGKLKPSPHSKTTLWKTLNRKDDTFERMGEGRWRLVGQAGDGVDDSPKVTVMIA